MNPLPFYSVEDNYTTNPRRERLNSLYCLGELEPISRNSSYKREWERLIPEYPFCFASGVPTSHSLLKYSLNEEKSKLSVAEADVGRCSGTLWSWLTSCCQTATTIAWGLQHLPDPKAVPLWGLEAMHFPLPTDFSISSKKTWGL